MSRRGFILSLIAEKTPFEEIIIRTEKEFPQIGFKQTHKNALSSILSQTGYIIPRVTYKISTNKPRTNAFNLERETNSDAYPKLSSEQINLVKDLSRFNAQPIIDRYRRNDLAGKSPSQILDFLVDKTIYRAFRYETPSVRYKKWRWHKTPDDLVLKLKECRCQEQFDEVATSIGQSLVDDWGKMNERGEPSRMNIGVAMKITNLVMKHLYFSGHVQNDSVLEWLHVPWDSFTLKPLRKVWQGYPPIPRTPSQGFVNNLVMYKQLLELISEISEEAGVPRIYYEIYAWDQAH